MSKAGVMIYFSNRWLLALCCLQFAVLAALLFNIRRAEMPAKTTVPAAKETRTAPLPTSPADPSELTFRGKPGPWGELEFVCITIELPDEFVTVDGRQFEKTRWLFTGYTRAQLTALFNACDLTPAQREELLRVESWSGDTDGIVITPSEKLIMEMSTPARAQIYSVLAESLRNDLQYWPYTFRTGGFDAWFQQSQLSEATIALVRRLMYPRASSLCFSDVPEVFAQIPSIPERRRLIKTLSRHSTLLMKLRVRPENDMNALTSYWARGGRAKDIGPLLESLAKVPGSVTIDIAHLLPPFARKRLNSYPFPPKDASQPVPDCFWTAFNFFNEPPEDRYYEGSVWSQELNNDYTIVPEPIYGDLVFLLRPDGSPLHAAVYLADDVVFTKNGGNLQQPWILMKMEDMIARYPVPYPVRIFFFRSKKLAS